MLKYGWNNHIFEIIEECDEGELKCRERYWQDYYDVLNQEKGLNCKLTSCGDKKLVHSDETKKKISESNKGQIGLVGKDNPMFGLIGENNPNFGSKRTEEQRKNISKSLKEKYGGDKNPMYGKNHTEESKNKIKEALKTKILKGEQHPFFGKKLHPDTLAKLSKVRKGMHEGEKHPKSRDIINTITGEIFKCIKTFCKDNNIVYSTFRSKLNGGLRNDTDFVLYDNYLKGDINIDKGQKRLIKIINLETQEIYNSIKSASKDYDGSYESLCYILKYSKNNKTKFRYYND